MSLFFSPPFSSVEMRCTRIKRVHYYCYYYYHLIKHVLCEIWHGEFFIACNFKLMRLIITNWKISHAVKANTYKTYKTKCAGNFTLFFLSSRNSLPFSLPFPFRDPPIWIHSLNFAGNWTLLHRHYVHFIYVYRSNFTKTLSGLCIILQLMRVSRVFNAKLYFAMYTKLVAKYWSN